MTNYLIAPDPTTFITAKKAFKKFATIDSNGVEKSQCAIDTVTILKDAKKQQEAYRDNTYKLDKKRKVFEKNIEKIDVWINKVYEEYGINTN